jgi:hypothetical protein
MLYLNPKHLLAAAARLKALVLIPDGSLKVYWGLLPVANLDHFAVSYLKGKTLLEPRAIED